MRMNQASNEYNLGYQVLQIKGEWIAKYKGQSVPFESDVLELPR